MVEPIASRGLGVECIDWKLDISPNKTCCADIVQYGFFQYGAMSIKRHVPTDRYAKINGANPANRSETSMMYAYAHRMRGFSVLLYTVKLNAPFH